MALLDDEVAIRSGLAELTAEQPSAPPARYAAIRRRAVVHRRRRVAGVVAAVAAVVAIAIIAPIGLSRLSGPGPVAPSRHYRVSESPPGPGSPGDLIASGRLSGMRWRALAQEQRANGLCWGATFGVGSGVSWSCANGSPFPVRAAGAPVSNFEETGQVAQVDVGTVRSDVTELKIFYSNGQILTARPVAVFGSGHAPWVALAAPYGAAVSEITAYGKNGAALTRSRSPGSPATSRWCGGCGRISRRCRVRSL